MVKSQFTKRETVIKIVTVSRFSLWTGGRAAEGTPFAKTALRK